MPWFASPQNLIFSYNLSSSTIFSRHHPLFVLHYTIQYSSSLLHSLISILPSSNIFLHVTILFPLESSSTSFLSSHSSLISFAGIVLFITSVCMASYFSVWWYFLVWCEFPSLGRSFAGFTVQGRFSVIAIPFSVVFNFYLGDIVILYLSSQADMYSLLPRVQKPPNSPGEQRHTDRRGCERAEYNQLREWLLLASRSLWPKLLLLWRSMEHGIPVKPRPSFNKIPAVNKRCLVWTKGYTYKMPGIKTWIAVYVNFYNGKQNRNCLVQFSFVVQHGPLNFFRRDFHIRPAVHRVIVFISFVYSYKLLL